MSAADVRLDQLPAVVALDPKCRSSAEQCRYCNSRTPTVTGSKQDLINATKNPQPGTQELFGRFGRHFLALERVLRAAVLDFVITGWNSLHYM